jgi:ribosomal protein L7/L12
MPEKTVQDMQAQIDVLSVLLEQLYVYIRPEAPSSLKAEVLLALGRDPNYELELVDVWITSFGTTRIAVIKEIRSACGYGLKECVDIMRACIGGRDLSGPDKQIPTLLKQRVFPIDAEKMKTNIEAQGGLVELRPSFSQKEV